MNQQQALELASKLAHDWASSCLHGSRSIVQLCDDSQEDPNEPGPYWVAVWFEDENSKTPDASARFVPIEAMEDGGCWAVRQECDEPWENVIWVAEGICFPCSGDR